MNDLRYPTLQFELIQHATLELRNSWIEDVSRISPILRQTVQNLSPEQLLLQYRPGSWTVRQVVHHMADNDMNAFIRFKRALTEDNPNASSYREDLWAELSDYETPVETSLVLLEAIHDRFTAILRTLHPSDFQRAFTSPTHGVMSLDAALQRFSWHGRHHIAQITSIFQKDRYL
jgi:uncharacterized damage-inducible protein DinB